MKIYGVYSAEFNEGHFCEYYLDKAKAISHALDLVEELKLKTKILQEDDLEDDLYKDWKKDPNNEDQWIGDYFYEHSVSVEEVEVKE